jgi:purine nucleosidase
MLRRLILAAVLSGLAVPTSAADRMGVIVDQDAGIDDLIAVALLLRSPAIQVAAVTITPADSYLGPATRATQLVVQRFGSPGITIAQGHSEGTNPFPDEWRRDAGRVLALPGFAGAGRRPTGRLLRDDAAHHLAAMLSGPGRYAVLETGPLTNIADALRLQPAIRDRITRIYVMGGAVRVKGNVEHAGHDGSAEWNIFNAPDAADEVLRSGIPITLVPLDATNHVPMTAAFLARLAREQAAPSRFAVQAWRLAAPSPSQPYYFWDTLTAAALVEPALVKTKRMKIRVVTTGPSQGRTLEDPRGTPIDVAVGADRRRVEQLFVDVLGRK